MKLFRNLLHLVSVYELVSTTVRADRFIAVSHSFGTEQIYRNIRRQMDPGPAMPATEESEIQMGICQDIISSEFWQNTVDVVSLDKMWAKLNNKKNKRIFKQLFHKKATARTITLGLKLQSDYQYENPYTRRKVSFKESRTETADEWVFLCVIKNRLTKEIEAVYVSRKYQENTSSQPMMVRFLFSNADSLEDGVLVLTALAEVPAKPYFSPDFSVEIHFLNTRNNQHPAETDELDPLCQQARQYSQHKRFCFSVLKSAYFDDIKISDISVPWFYTDKCTKKSVIFQTAQAMKEGAGRLLEEWMLLCEARKTDSRSRTYFFLSRAYRSGQVFLFNTDYFHGSVYLENLSTNVAIVDSVNR